MGEHDQSSADQQAREVARDLAVATDSGDQHRSADGSSEQQSLHHRETVDDLTAGRDDDAAALDTDEERADRENAAPSEPPAR